jgi:hypothetical protein
MCSMPEPLRTARDSEAAGAKNLISFITGWARQG